MAIDTTRMAVILNPASGRQREGAAEEQAASAFRAAGLRPEIIVVGGGADPGKIAAERAGAGCGAVVAAGGDGTVSAVGSALAGTDTALGVLPTGTLNHFARDLQLPLELEAAARVIAAGRAIAVDVAEVNGRVFLNNSSIGLYPTMVAEREILMSRGMPKKLAMLRAALTALWRFPNPMVRVTTDQAEHAARSPLVFVGNNEYEFAGWEAGTRSCLADGVLQLCTFDNPSRSVLLHSVFLALTGRVEAAPSLHAARAKWVKIETLRRHVKVALDGEVTRMTSPLRYSIRPGALQVLVPQPRSGDGAER